MRLPSDERHRSRARPRSRRADCHPFVTPSAYIANPFSKCTTVGNLPMFKSLKACSVTALLITCVLVSGYSRAQSAVFSQVHTVAASNVAVPVEEPVTITTAGTYQVTLTDFGAQLPTPAPLKSVKLAITSGGTLVGTPMTAAGSMQFSATAADYVIHVIGLPDSTKAGSGPIGITVTNTADNSQVAAFSASLALPNVGIPNNDGVLEDTF